MPSEVEAPAGASIRPHLLKLVLAVAAAVLLAWLVVRSAAVNALIESDPAAASLFAPNDPRVTLAVTDAAVRQERGAVAQTTVDSALAASLRAPLDETPFLLAGASALRTGKGEQAERLLVEARERNPRSRTARFLLLEYYVRNGQAKDAAEEMAVLTRLMPDARPLLVAGLARFAESMPDGTAIAQVLEGDPSAQNAVLEHLAATGASPELILTLSRGKRPGPDAKWPDAVVAALVNRGDIEEAYARWRRFAGFPAGPAPAGLFNAGFEDLPAHPPFNWRLTSAEAGSAQLGNGLRIAYPGNAPAELAEQLLLLPPGSYNLSFEAEGEAGEAGSGLAWTLTCHASDARLTAVAVKPSPVIPQSNSGSFAVPAGCTAQWIRLVGRPGRGTGTSNLSITELAITEADSQ